MIDTSLNRNFKAEKGSEGEYNALPEGVYTLIVKEVKPWVEQKKTVKVIQRDANGEVILDDKGEKLRETIPDCVFYTAQVLLEVHDGEYAKRRIYHGLTTHPNMQFIIPNFLHGIGIADCKASEIQSKVVGRLCMANVFIESYIKKTIDKDTGLETSEERLVNKIKSFRTPPLGLNAKENDPIDEDLF